MQSHQRVCDRMQNKVCVPLCAATELDHGQQQGKNGDEQEGNSGRRTTSPDLDIHFFAMPLLFLKGTRNMRACLVPSMFSNR